MDVRIIYLVVWNEYDSDGVAGVYSTRDLAEAHTLRGRDLMVEPWYIDPQPVPDNLAVWSGSSKFDGGEMDVGKHENVRKVKQPPDVIRSGTMMDRLYYSDIVAKDEAQALEIAERLRQDWLARPGNQPKRWPT